MFRTPLMKGVGVGLLGALALEATIVYALRPSPLVFAIVSILMAGIGIGIGCAIGAIASELDSRAAIVTLAALVLSFSALAVLAVIAASVDVGDRRQPFGAWTFLLGCVVPALLGGLVLERWTRPMPRVPRAIAGR